MNRLSFPNLEFGEFGSLVLAILIVVVVLAGVGIWAYAGYPM